MPANQYADERDAPDLAAQNGLERALQIKQVNDIVANAQQQSARISVEELVAAFLFFYDHDAFIDFDQLAAQ